jgi:hypothetical protein
LYNVCRVPGLARSPPAPRGPAGEYTRGQCIMSEPRFIRFVKGRYWVTLTKTAEHPQRVFPDRYAAKVWLVQQGVPKSAVEDCLLEADAGTSVRVLLHVAQSG